MGKRNGIMRTIRIVNIPGVILFFFICALLLHFYAPGCRADENQKNVAIPEAADAGISADLVWAESDGNDYEIFISYYDGNTWSPKIQVTDNVDNDIVPAVIRDNTGVLWVIWTRTAEGTRNLYFRFFDGQKWSVENRIETGFAVNLSAAVAVDRNNQIWLVWVSFDGVDDDIFFSRWNGAGWSSPMRVNADDSTPDIQPLIGIGSDGSPWVRWSGFEDGDYQVFESRWNGNDWGPETMLPKSIEADQPAETISAGSPSPDIVPESMVNTRPTEIAVGDSNGPTKILPLPDFLTDPWKAGIYIEGRGWVKSRPLRTMIKEVKTQ